MCCGHLYLLCQCLWARCASVRVLAVPTRADTSAAAVLLEDIVILVPCWGGQALAGREAWRWRRWHALAAADTSACWAQSSLSSSLTGIDFLGFFAGGSTRALPPTGVGERGGGPCHAAAPAWLRGTGVAARAEAAVASGAAGC